MQYKRFEEHFWKLQNKLKNGENFAFSRYSDGEMNIMQNQHLVLDNKSTRLDGKCVGMKYDDIDYKEYDPNRHGPLRDRLIGAYQHNAENYYVGLSCPCCVGKQNSDWMKAQRGPDNEHSTWANLLVNSNYPLFLGHMVPLLQDKDVVFICNKKSTFDKLPFKVKKDFRIGQNAMINDVGLVEEVGEYIKAGNIKDHVFLFSASTLSNILIYEMYKSFPENTYIDIGTTLHPMMDMPIQRNYLKGYWLNSGNTEIYKCCTW
jgi:hypothetical protein